MKNTILAIAITLSLAFGFTATNINAETSKVTANTETTNYIYVRVIEDGAIWVYVYNEDGTYVAKYIEQQL